MVCLESVQTACSPSSDTRGNLRQSRFFRRGAQTDLRLAMFGNVSRETIMPSLSDVGPDVFVFNGLTQQFL